MIYDVSVVSMKIFIGHDSSRDSGSSEDVDLALCEEDKALYCGSTESLMLAHVASSSFDVVQVHLRDGYGRCTGSNALELEARHDTWEIYISRTACALHESLIFTFTERPWSIRRRLE